MNLTDREKQLSKASDNGYKSFYASDPVPPQEYSAGILRQAWDQGWNLAKQNYNAEYEFYPR